MIGRKNLEKMLGLSEAQSQMASRCGIEPTGRAGSYMFVDDRKVFDGISQKYKGLVEIMDIYDAIKKYGLKDKYWKLVSPEKNEFARMAQSPQGGYYIRISKGCHVELPLQSCMLLDRGKNQILHNVIVAEDGSDATIISGCASHESLKSGLHVGVSEVYVGRGATLNFTMVHNWGENITVRPVTAVQVKDKGTYVSNYLCMKPVKDLKAFPKAVCGRGGKAIFNTILYGKKNSLIEMGEEIELAGDESVGTINSRAILEGSSKVITRGKIVGLARAKGHIECKGILLSDKAELRSIPEIDARNPGVDLSHEAAIGKVAEKELLYLMSRGLSQEKATSLIVSGFLNVPLPGVPDWVRQEILGR
ncbi:MAG: SufD family Fe-S cluster assembly protein [Candidatus Aenigmarchaeota archaeon]|nr:SufD family Fe-S cluster assembly protein [Candidatus Aenigmarchaeota archaeon]